MTRNGCKKIIFSSSTIVYGQPKVIPCVKDFPLAPINPYGCTNFFIEEISHDIQKEDPKWIIIFLRYFNPIKAHPRGQIGEDPKGIPTSFMPFIQQLVIGRQPVLNVYGNDYPTQDGTAVQDYIHVVDLADGHISALQKLFITEDIGCRAYKLGTRHGTSILELVVAFEKASRKKYPLQFCSKHLGDATVVYANTEKVEHEFGWKAKHEMSRGKTLYIYPTFLAHTSMEVFKNNNTPKIECLKEISFLGKPQARAWVSAGGKKTKILNEHATQDDDVSMTRSHQKRLARI